MVRVVGGFAQYRDMARQTAMDPALLGGKDRGTRVSAGAALVCVVKVRGADGFGSG